MAETNRVLEIRVSWGDEALETTILERPREVTVGPSETADVRCGDTPREDGTTESSRVIARANGNEWEVLVPPLGAVIGGLTVRAAVIDAPPKAARDRVDLRPLSWIGLSAAFAGAALFAFFLAPPSASAINFDSDHSSSRLSEFVLAHAETILPPPSKGSAGSSERAALAPEPEGKGTAPGPNTQSPPRGKSTAHQGGAVTAREAVASVINTLGAAGATLPMGMGGPFGSSFANHGLDPDVYALINGPPGGAGVVGPKDVGRGAGCHGDDCGDSELVGIGGYRTKGDGPSGPAVTLTDRPRPGVPVPMVQPLPPDVFGGLSADQIRRQIQLNRAQFRACYSDTLRSSPDTAGRVSVKFVVRNDGAVMSADASGDTRSDSLEACVARAMTRVSFPATTGVTVVTYPFVFASPP